MRGDQKGDQVGDSHFIPPSRPIWDIPSVEDKVPLSLRAAENFFGGFRVKL